MTFQNAAELVAALADHAARKKMRPGELTEQTGIPEERLRLLDSGAWETLTLREIALILEALEIDPRTL